MSDTNRQALLSTRLRHSYLTRDDVSFVTALCEVERLEVSVRQVVSLQSLRAMTAEERVQVVQAIEREFCLQCGGPQDTPRPCQCWNDD